MVDLPEIAIIGKEGYCCADHNIAAELWSQANSHFNEVAELGMKEKDGSYVGFWGAMSDETRSFQPWEDNFSRGLYLAGVEVTKEKEPPEGWTKWIMPARKYLIADVEPGKYQEIFLEMLQVEIPARKMRLSGAVCDYTEPGTGKNMMFFPVEQE